jgi:hypothetical protein
MTLARSAAVAELVSAVAQSAAAYVALAALSAIGRDAPRWIAVAVWSQAALALLLAVALWRRPGGSRFVWTAAVTFAVITILDVLWSARRLIDVQWPSGLGPRLAVSVIGLKLLSQVVVLALFVVSVRGARVIEASRRSEARPAV